MRDRSSSDGSPSRPTVFSGRAQLRVRLDKAPTGTLGTLPKAAKQTAAISPEKPFLLWFSPLLLGKDSLWKQFQSEFLRRPADTIIQGEKPQSCDSRSGRQDRSQMNRIERTDWLAWKWLPGAIHDLRSNTQRVPVRSHCREVRSPVRCLDFRQFPYGGCSNEDPVAFNQSQIGSDDDLGSRQ